MFSSVASERGTVTTSLPRRAAILPHSAFFTASAALRPYRVARMRSWAVGVPPRWRWPRTTWRVSMPVLSFISSARVSPMPPS